MGKLNDIRQRLLTGSTTKQLIEEGYAKSSVHYVVGYNLSPLRDYSASLSLFKIWSQPPYFIPVQGDGVINMELVYRQVPNEVYTSSQTF